MYIEQQMQNKSLLLEKNVHCKLFISHYWEIDGRGLITRCDQNHHDLHRLITRCDHDLTITCHQNDNDLIGSDVTKMTQGNIYIFFFQQISYRIPPSYSSCTVWMISVSRGNYPKFNRWIFISSRIIIYKFNILYIILLYKMYKKTIGNSFHYKVYRGVKEEISIEIYKHKNTPKMH